MTTRDLERAPFTSWQLHWLAQELQKHDAGEREPYLYHISIALHRIADQVESALTPAPAATDGEKRRPTIAELEAILARPSGEAQGRCETTLTERFAYPECKCGTYPENLGPCKTWETGANPERCVYCDHKIECHKAVTVPTESSQEDGQRIRPDLNKTEPSAASANAVPIDETIQMRLGKIAESILSVDGDRDLDFPSGLTVDAVCAIAKELQQIAKAVDKLEVLAAPYKAEIERLTFRVTNQAVSIKWYQAEYDRLRAPASEGENHGAVKMTEDQIKHMISRFLFWRLPENFSPDAGISFKKMFNENTDRPMKHEPTGTNLFDVTQTEAMVRHMIDGLPAPAPSEAGGAMPEWESLRKLAEKALKVAPAPWHHDTVKCEGSYGSGPNPSTGFDAYQLLAYVNGKWLSICDSLNSDITVVEEDHDEDGKNAWDESARHIFAFLAAANPETVLTLIRSAVPLRDTGKLVSALEDTREALMRKFSFRN